MKKCPKCGENKPISEFQKNASTKDGLQRECSSCWNAYCKERWETDRLNPERLRVRRAGHLRTKFGITLEQYDEMAARYDGRCWSCRRLPGEVRAHIGRLGPMLSVDHDHNCCPGQKTCGICLRGLLCNDCNRAAGFIDKVGLANILAYYTGAELVKRPVLSTDAA